ncbi:thioredoxin domain-containing protein [Streptomyces sp. NPDC001852]|uniref:thioredoxin domain-containing protein n=1 Tax=Streptomyces sp. NPDC001852 TaxID=3364619 RepID=UPI0036927F32
MTTTPRNTTGVHGTTLYYGNPETRHALQVFLELRDRASRRMAESLLGAMRQVADEGKFVVKFHFAALLDDTVGGIGSQRGLSALGAASDVGQQKFIDYLGVLFAHQPFPPGDDNFADPSVLLSLAAEVEGLRSEEFDHKITSDTYMDWAGETVGNFQSFGVVGTPVVWRDDEVIPVVKNVDDGPAISPEEFLTQLQQH